MAQNSKPSKTTAKKPAAKKPAAKKPTAKAAKKPAAKKAAPAKKPAAKKPAVKKAAPAKKPAVKKPVVKKAAPAKKPAVKKPVVKKAAPAKKPAAKKPAVKKPAVKKAAPAKKPAAKTAVKKPAGVTPVKKAVTVKAPPKVPVVKPVKPSIPEPVFVFPNLFDAYNTNTLPHDQGLIITSAFRDNSSYTIYQVTAYSGVKEISRNDSELRFSCENAKKFFVLVEPFDYFFKYILDPADRSVSDSIPYRKNELEVFTTVDQTQVMVAKATRDTDPSFAVSKPHSGDLAAVFSKTPGIFKTIAAFFRETLIKDLNMPQVEAEKASQLIATEMEKAV